MLTLSPLTVSRTDSRKDVHGRWTSLKTYSLLVLSAARKDKQDIVHQDGSSMPGAAAPGKYPVNYLSIQLNKQFAVKQKASAQPPQLREAEKVVK